MRKLDIQGCHAVLLDLAKEFHRICTLHHIPYIMVGGTMLGAIRHKGFIPWDDDMDFAIQRQHYHIFKEACKKELKHPYKFINEDNSDYAILGIGKIVDTRTKTKEIYSIDTTEDLGVNIDIFILENTDSKKNLLSLNARTRYAFKLQKLLFVNPQNRSKLKKILARTAKILLPLNKKTLIKYIHSEFSKERKGVEHNMFFNWAGAYGFKELIPQTLIGTPTLYEFEDTSFYGPEHYEEYLTHFYSNYMQLPPEDKRHIHFQEKYIND